MRVGIKKIEYLINYFNENNKNKYQSPVGTTLYKDSLIQNKSIKTNGLDGFHSSNKPNGQKERN